MPFTPAHVAAALPLLRLPLVPAGLVIGTIAPDLPYFVPGGEIRSWTHAWIGVPTVDLAIGLAAFLLWRHVLREPVVDTLPAYARERIRPERGQDWKRPGWSWPLAIVLLVVSILIGTVTHLAWDAFTHSDSWLVLQVPALTALYGPLPGWQWAQYASGVFGIAAVVSWSAVVLRRTPPAQPRDRVLTPLWRGIGWAALVAAAVAGAGATWAHGILRGDPPLDSGLVFLVARVGIGCGIAVAVIGTVAWHLAARRGTAPR